MKSLVKKGISTISNDGGRIFIRRVINFGLVKLKRMLIRSNFGNWESLKGKFNGKRIFILGNGPSLNDTQLYLLKDEYTMCFNRVNLMMERLNWLPNFYVMTDDLLVKDFAKEVVADILPKVDYAFFPDLHPSNVNFKKRIGEHPNVYYLKTDIPEFRADLPNCGINKTVTNAGLQIAAYLGFTEIYLIGVDMSFSDQKVDKANSRVWTAKNDDDPNHFDPRYFGEGRKYHNPTVHEMFEQFDIAKKFFDNLNVKVYNAGVGGKLEVFPRVDYKSLFNFTTEEEEQIFMELAYKNNSYTNFSEVLEKSIKIEDIKDFDEKLDSFIIPSEMLNVFIQKVIFTHIPLGPFKNKYIFVKREKNDNR
jgi:hypothetical protein